MNLYEVAKTILRAHVAPEPCDGDPYACECATHEEARRTLWAELDEEDKRMEMGR